jgi:hypothetical protein
MDRKDELHHDHAGKNHILSHDDHPGVGDHIGEAAGGISGVFAGAAIGSVGGPIGTIIGGIAGAMGGWWAGRTVSEAATHLTHDDDTYYRTHYEGSSTKLADRGYEDVRPAYHLGHIASHNPDYAGRNFDAVETDLRKGWSEDLRGKHGDWDSVRGFARHGYEYGSTRRNAGTAATTGASFYGSGATSSAADKARNTADRVGDKAENAWDRTKAGAQNVGNKLADKADDVKDRVDGNPASKPGPDATDANRRF